MNRFTFLHTLTAGLALFAGNAVAVGISGAGATFPMSIYKQWGKSYEDQAGVRLDYQGTGSGDGIRQIEAKTVDFGASDKPLKAEELEKAGLMQFPTVVGGAVPVINVAGIESGKLRLDGPVLADIFMGKITKWNAPAIAALNPDIKLPDENIHVIHRSDSSGTTFIFTNYLSKVSAEWKSTMGEGTSVPWKVGTGCRTNLLIPICLYQTNNSIGYMDYAYAAKTNMNMVHMKNQAGQFVPPGDGAFAAAAAHAKWQQGTGFYEILTDEPGNTTWPIVGATFILMQKTQDKPVSGKSVLKFFDWAYSQGDTLASEIGYVPLPKQVQNQIRQAWAEQLKDNAGGALCPDCAAAK
jgi:phosphate transport system substrate-binding protein